MTDLNTRTGKTDRELGLPQIIIDWPPKPDAPPSIPQSPPLTRVGRRPMFRYGWRSVIGGIGRLFISLGMLLFGFVGYQLWGTGIQTAHAQDNLRSAFAAAQATTPRLGVTTAPTTTAPTTTTAVASTVAGAAPAVSSTTVKPTTTTTVAASLLPIPEDGAAVASLEIPRIGMKNSIIVSGVTVDDLKKGVGHFRTTPLPGQRGNVALAGHRTTSGAPFGRLDELKNGDQIIFTNAFGEKYVYRMTGQDVVVPTDISVLAPTDGPTLTLATCTPRYTSTNRLIIHAELDIAASTGPVREPTIPNDTKPDVIPAEDPTTTIATPPTTLAAIATADSVATSVATATTVRANPTTATTIGDIASASASDNEDKNLTEAFTQGWFSDKNAAPQVGLWGAACAFVGIGAWLLSRKSKRNLVGFLVGVLPFIVVLYFFYENVNRLLPPGL